MKEVEDAQHGSSQTFSSGLTGAIESLEGGEGSDRQNREEALGRFEAVLVFTFVMYVLVHRCVTTLEKSIDLYADTGA